MRLIDNFPFVALYDFIHFAAFLRLCLFTVNARFDGLIARGEKELGNRGVGLS
jgi:hypothetical protein